MFDDFRDRSQERTVEVRYLDLLDENDKAWLILLTDGFTKWLPKSQCQVDEDSKTVTVPEWLAVKEGLENE